LRIDDISNFTFAQLDELASKSFVSVESSKAKRIYYFDDEEDRIVIRNDDDLKEAIITMKEDLGMKILKFYVEVLPATTAVVPPPAPIAAPAPAPAPIVEDYVEGDDSYTPLGEASTAPPPAAAAAAAPKTSDEHAEEEDGLDTLLSLFNLEVFAPFARQWISVLESTEDEKAVYLSGLLKNPEFAEVVAEVRTSESGSKIVEAVEEGMSNGIPPMVTMKSFVEDGTMKAMLQPVMDKFPELLTHFPLLNRIVDPEEAKKAAAAAPQVHMAVSCDGCGMNPIIGLRFKCNDCHDFDFCGNCRFSVDHKAGHTFSEKEPRSGHGAGHAFGMAGLGGGGPCDSFAGLGMMPGMMPFM
jgi:hypothetical protein